MAVTVEQVRRIPAGNLRVARTHFAAVWGAAERLSHEQGEAGIEDWYIAGVVKTCRWLAGALHQTSWGRVQPAAAPVSQTRATAYEELIEAEFQAAELLALRQPGLGATQPGWCEGIWTTLRWAWRGEGAPPLSPSP